MFTRIFGKLKKHDLSVPKESMASLIKVSFLEFLSKALYEMYYANNVGIPKKLLCLFYKMKYILSYLTCSSTSKWRENGLEDSESD